jgi:pimeloyl-ACP methyl ester carboxylesterase
VLPRLAILLPLTACSLGAQSAGRVLTVSSAVDQSQQPYALYVPPNLEPGRKYPLVLSLHSEDSDHRLNLAQVLSAQPRTGYGGYAVAAPLRDVPFLVACPLARGSMGYQGIAEQDVYDVLADVERRFPVDEDRVYLTGISMGGGAALRLTLTRPDVWAAVAPLCADILSGSDEFAGNLLDVPVRLFHGDLDPIVPVASSRALQKRLLDAGVPVTYFEYPAVRHNVWDRVYRDGGVFDWFDSLRRNPNPEHVRFATRSYQYSSAYWVRIDSLTPGMLAVIDARREGTDLRIDTVNIDGFTIRGGASAGRIFVDGAPVRMQRAPRTGPDVSLTKSPAGWRAGMSAPAGKHAGAEGPMVAAVSSRHIYVYGSLGTHTAEELERRRQVARDAAAWSTVRSHLSLQLPVKADSEVTADDLDAANLVLFGTARTNSLIARFADRFPLTLSPDAADYGLLFVFPIGNHYALVNSGLPWWTGADDAAGAGYALAPAQFRLLSAFGDYVLFRGSVAHVVAEGRFDRDWKLPPAAAARLQAAGTVVVH